MVIHTVSATQRQTLWESFRGIRRRPLPKRVAKKVPVELAQATEQAYQLGLQAGYGKGLVDGVGLVLEIGDENPDKATGLASEVVSPLSS